jgi:hypothetical protein
MKKKRKEIIVQGHAFTWTGEAKKKRKRNSNAGKAQDGNVSRVSRLPSKRVKVGGF